MALLSGDALQRQITPTSSHGTVSSMTDGPGVERVFETPDGPLELMRHPLRPRSTLRAWDAADAYLLRHLAEQPPAEPTLVVNDGFGALAVGLHGSGPSVVVDTAMSEIAVAKNLEQNKRSPLQVWSDLPAAAAAANGEFTRVVIKVPKSLGQLEDQLHHLRPIIGPQTTILGAGMVRDIHTSTLQLFETIVGPTTTSLAERKARLIHCQLDPELTPPPNPWPLVWRHDGLAIHNHGGVFSAKSLDIGTRFLLEHLPSADTGSLVVDLGCGNGILGVAVARANPDAELTFVDASARAVRSAEATWSANLDNRTAWFHRTDRLINVVEEQSVDLILNNPPFHEERAIGDATAWEMFVDSRAVLRPGGQLLVVGNQHLGHHTRLKKIFGNCKTVASNRKFVVLRATR